MPCIPPFLCDPPCPICSQDLGSWAQRVFFYLAEGNYPFPSTYITFSLLPGQSPIPLPAWPQRVACKSLNKDFGIKLSGSVRDVNYTLTLGDIVVKVDWANVRQLRTLEPGLTILRTPGTMGLALLSFWFSLFPFFPSQLQCHPTGVVMCPTWYLIHANRAGSRVGPAAPA